MTWNFAAALLVGVSIAGCAAAQSPYNQGPLRAAIDFGDDASSYANDGECDDHRFDGPGMAAAPLLGADVGHDASDCAAGFDAGRLRYVADKRFTGVAGGIDFGDNASEYAFDRECDDGRFSGDGVTETPLLPGDVGHDADDCHRAWKDGTLTVSSSPAPTAPSGFTGVYGGVDFGDNASTWAFDDECDDPRFEGEGMTDTTLLEDDIGHDASDCHAAFVSGAIRLGKGI